MMGDPRTLTRSPRLAPSPASGRGYKRREHLLGVSSRGVREIVISRERRAALSVTPHPARDREIYSPLLVACAYAPHVPTPPHPSAQADIAFSQPRIHSPRLARCDRLTTLPAPSESGHRESVRPSPPRRP
jgi:hypothetical protein